jgi:hypothetical protein
MPHAQSIIDEYTSQGFVVMVGSWDCTTLCPSVDQWFHDLAANNVNNSRVWYNCNNEPSADLGDWVTLQDQCVNDVRSAGNPNIVVADALVLPRTPAGRARVICTSRAWARP